MEIICAFNLVSVTFCLASEQQCFLFNNHHNEAITASQELLDSVSTGLFDGPAHMDSCSLIWTPSVL